MERHLIPIISATVLLCAVTYSFQFVSFTHPKELVICLGLLLAGALLPLRRGSLWEGLWAFAPLWLLLLWCATVHGAMGRSAVPIETVKGLVKLLTLLLFAALAFQAQQSERGRRQILLAILGSALAAASLALCQYAGLLPSMFPIFPDYDQRVYSVFGNQDLLGGYVAMGIPLAIHFFATSHSRTRAGIALGATVLLLGALLLSGSRSAWLAAAAAVGIYALLGNNAPVPRRKIGFLLAGLGVAVILVCAAAPDATVGRLAGAFRADDIGTRARLWIWDATARTAADYPLTGVGLGNYSYWSPHYAGAALHAPGGSDHYSNDIPILHAHSDPLELLAETGAVGLLLAAWMLTRLLRTRGPAWGGVAALLVFSLFNGVYHSPPHALAGFLLAGNLLAGARQHQSAGRTTDSDSRSILWAIPIAATGAIIFNALVVSIPSFDLAALPPADESLTANSREQYDRALARPWPSPIVEVQGSMLMLAEGETGEARTSLMRAKKRLDTGRIHYLLGYLTELEGDPRQAEAAYEAAVWRWPRNLDVWLGWMGVTPQERRETRLAEAQRWLSEANMRLLRDAATLH